MDNAKDDERLRKSSEGEGLDDAADGEPPVHDGKSAHEELLLQGLNITMENQPLRPPVFPSQHQNPINYLSGMTQIARKPISPNTQMAAKDDRSIVKPLAKHSMGPREMHPRLHSDVSPISGAATGKENIMPRRWSEQPPIVQPPLPPRPEALAGTPYMACDAGSRFPSVVDAPRPSLSDQEMSFYSRSDHQRQLTENEGLSLTLIRRYDGSQWNVGKIINAHERETLWQQRPTGWQDDLSICISTPGYSNFHDPQSSKASGGLDQVFERRLSKLQRRSRDQFSIENHANRVDDRKSRMSIEFRRLSKPRLNETSNKMKSDPLSENELSGTKGYGFYSPWNGICEFSQGISGHALKCKHTAPTEGSPAITVSELRFNLPTSNNRAAASPIILRSPGRPRNRSRSSYFSSFNGSDSPSLQTHNQESHRTDDTNDRYDRFDLSLGQERAGGGFGGKQAKLGKLIIEPEGLKMLDLLVAANMGLWWKAYEKSA